MLRVSRTAVKHAVARPPTSRCLSAATRRAGYRGKWRAGTAILAAGTAAVAAVAATAALTATQTSRQPECSAASPQSEIPPPRDMRRRMEAFVKGLQNEIVAELERIDGTRFQRDSWKRSEGGEGLSCVLQDGNVFEKGGVNVSVVHGGLTPAMQKQMTARGVALPDGVKHDFFAAGISMVLHPHNPMAPTVHLNYRYFEIVDASGKVASWWFGGGSDLTPSYLFDEDARHFHGTLKAACDAHDRKFYPAFKAWADRYFFLPHRGEARGIGGVFFDDLNDRDPEALFAFVRDQGAAFLPSYVPILERRRGASFTPEEKEWQQLRRGRYVEFNLVYDRGTKFGLATPSARVESILMSLPLTARWEYMHEPLRASREASLVDVLQRPRDWGSPRRWWQGFF